MNRPWYLGLRKWSFAIACVISLTWLALDRFLDGAQYLAGLAGVVSGFLAANHLSSRAKEAQESRS